MLYTNNFSRQAPKTRARLFFKFFFESLANKRKIVKRIASVDIDQSAMCYISIAYLSRQALQNNGIFLKFLNHFQIIDRNEYSKR